MLPTGRPVSPLRAVVTCLLVAAGWARRVTTHVLRAVRAACVIRRGPYGGMPRVRRALEAWVQAAGYERAGGERIVYLQHGAEPELEVPEAFLADDVARYVTEVQLLLR